MRRALVIVLACALLGTAAACAPAVTPRGSSDIADWPRDRSYYAVQLSENDLPKGLAEGTDLVLTLGEPGELQVIAGCNTLQADGRVDGGRIVIDEIASTKMGCPEAVARQESWVADFLRADPRWSVDGEEFTLRTGQSLVRLHILAPVPQRNLDAWPRDKSFIAAAIVDDDSGEDLFVDATVLVTFHEPFSLTATAGCNTIAVTARSFGDRLVPESVVTTDAACVGVQGEAEKWLLDFFARQPTWHAGPDEVLLLTFSDRIYLRPEGAARDRPDGWPLGRAFASVAVTEDGARKSLVPDTEISVRFTRAPDDLLVNAGCNTMSFRIHAEAGRIVVDEVRSTAVGCLDDRAAQDAWVYEFFDSGPTWTLAGDELVLRSGGTEIRLAEK